jgi:hypothetical protein
MGMKGVLRPKMTVLSDAALIPPENIGPPPQRFTHEVTAEQPYYYAHEPSGARPDGTFPAGTKVALIGHHGSMSRVADHHGLRVVTPRDGLRPLAKKRRQKSADHK